MPRQLPREGRFVPSGVSQPFPVLASTALSRVVRFPAADMGLGVVLAVPARDSAASRLSPQKDESCHDAESASASMESAPPLKHTPRFSRGGLRRCVHETP